MSNAPDLSNNRAFFYGDGVFETIRVLNGRLLFLEDHFSRLSNGMKTLDLEHPDLIDFPGFADLISQAHKSASSPVNSRIRLQVYREGSGWYTPQSKKASLQLLVQQAECGYQETDGLRLTDYHLQHKAPGVLASLKTTSSLLYVHAALTARQTGFDDILICNTAGNVIESSRSNLFVVTKGRIVTPPLSDGMVSGVMRKQLMEMLGDAGLEVFEMPVKPEDLEMADEIWLTNVVRGIDWVREYHGKNYDNSVWSEALEIILSQLQR